MSETVHGSRFAVHSRPAETAAATQPLCCILTCQRRAAEGVYCRAHADEAARWLRLVEEPGPAIEALPPLPRPHARDEGSGRREQTKAVAALRRGQPAAGELLAAADWIAIGVLSACLALILLDLLPWLRDWYAMASSGLRGAW